MKIHLDNPSEEVQIQIIPLIDVIFCILTFFILAALQLTRQQAISIDLPKAATGTAIPGLGTGNSQFRELLVVTIAPNGQTYVDKNLIDRSQLAQALEIYLRQNPNGTVVLNAPPTAIYNDVIQVLDLMRAVGGDRVALATTPTNSPLPGLSPTAETNPFPTASPTFNPFDPFSTPQPENSPGTATPDSGIDLFPKPSPESSQQP
jgi:biopolymer transport protein ExbD